MTPRESSPHALASSELVPADRTIAPRGHHAPRDTMDTIKADYPDYYGTDSAPPQCGAGELRGPRPRAACANLRGRTKKPLGIVADRSHKPMKLSPVAEALADDPVLPEEAIDTENLERLGKPVARCGTMLGTHLYTKEGRATSSTTKERWHPNNSTNDSPSRPTTA